MTDSEIIKILTEKLEQASRSKWVEIGRAFPESHECVDVWVNHQDFNGRVCNCFYNISNDEFWCWESRTKFKICKSNVSHWMLVTNPEDK
ncbi:hypothetical protein NVP1155O_35 [Vibrio phage 1.155.O._10N.222.55.B3]|nr:hypothetical protein NVP1155O_35 [Vibrio phage 1.155.O._10N.222.55.B3]